MPGLDRHSLFTGALSGIFLSQCLGAALGIIAGGSMTGPDRAAFGGGLVCGLAGALVAVLVAGVWDVLWAAARPAAADAADHGEPAVPGPGAGE